MTNEKVREIRTICQHHKGAGRSTVVIKTNKGKVYATAGKSLSVNPDVEFCRKMKQLVGEEIFALAK